MSITPESVEQLLNSEDFGERLRAVNQLRQVEPAIAYKLIQIAINDKTSGFATQQSAKYQPSGRRICRTL